MGFFPTDFTTNSRHSPHHKNKKTLTLSLSLSSLPEILMFHERRTRADQILGS
jgi:hypothetical protein